MIKFYKIKHEGFHRIGIFFGYFLIFLGPGFFESLDRGYLIEYADYIEIHFDIFRELLSMGGIALFGFLLYPILYFLGYSILKIFNWIVSGFSKNLS